MMQSVYTNRVNKDNAKEVCMTQYQLRTMIHALSQPEGSITINQDILPTIQLLYLMGSSDNGELVIRSNNITFDSAASLASNKDIVSISKSNTGELVIKANTITFDSVVSLASNKDIVFISKSDIVFTKNAKLIKSGESNLYLKAGLGSESGKVIFENPTEAQVVLEGGGKVMIHYHPEPSKRDTVYTHKYHNPYYYSKHVIPSDAVEGYMLINNIQDLQDIRYFISGNYALSQDITGKATNSFVPIGNANTPFAGNFDGNNYGIIDLEIKGDDQVGIFGLIYGSKVRELAIHNLWLESIRVIGQHCVGILSADAVYANFKNILFKAGNTISAQAVAGGLVGSASGISVFDIKFDVKPQIIAEEYSGDLAGAIRESEICMDDINHLVGFCIDCYCGGTNL